jgi:hypothetical protein
MTRSKLKVQEAEDYKPSKAVPLFATGKSNGETATGAAKMVTAPDLAAMRVIRSAEAHTGLDDAIDVPALMALLRDQAAAVSRGDLSQFEAMLLSQATALQSLFSRLTDRGMAQDQIAAFDANMRMALRAQSQCRATLETLAVIKNPPIVFARQANVTTGPQQVNNGAARSRAREKAESANPTIR